MIHNSLFYLSIFIVLGTIIPLIRHDFWVFRVFEYPRLQKLVLTGFTIAAILVFAFPQTLTDGLMLVALSLCMLYLLYLILPFTFLGRKQIVSAKGPSGKNNLKILIANVYQENKQASAYHKLIRSCNPDVVLLVETNDWWRDQMNPIGEHYPHQLKIPLENTYGMLLYSKLELRDESVKFLVEEDIPSIETTVTLRSGQQVKLFCLHPKPPVPQENPRSTERDKEIMMVAEKAKNCALPVVVMGDLNDVAWSYTTELFGKVSGLLDPRRGRGFFNSFNARYFFLRFPLDHIFCSKDFALNSIKRLPSCGSDHFPMCVDLQYQPAAAVENEAPEASLDDLELAKEKINANT